MTVLDMYCKKILASKGFTRHRMLRNLRKYLKLSTIAELTEEIGQMTNINCMKVLWEAGLNKWLQVEVERRQLELTVRRRE